LHTVVPSVLTGIVDVQAGAYAARFARPRSEARKIAVAGVRTAVRSFLPRTEARNLVKTDAELPGKRGKYRYDAVVSNGAPYLAVHGLSLEAPISQHIEDSVFWMLRDVRESDPDLPIGMVVLKPSAEIFGNRNETPDYERAAEQYDRALRVFEEFGAAVLEEGTVEDWAGSIVSHLPPASDFRRLRDPRWE
jgi:hypothetical protein